MGSQAMAQIPKKGIPEPWLKLNFVLHIFTWLFTRYATTDPQKMRDLIDTFWVFWGVKQTHSGTFSEDDKLNWA